jgi:hypothetical protein
VLVTPGAASLAGRDDELAALVGAALSGASGVELLALPGVGHAMPLLDPAAGG